MPDHPRTTDVLKALKYHIERTCPHYSVKYEGHTRLTINFGKRNKKPRINLILQGTTLLINIKTKVEANQFWSNSHKIDLNDPKSIDLLDERLKNPHHA